MAENLVHKIYHWAAVEIETDVPVLSEHPAGLDEVRAEFCGFPRRISYSTKQAASVVRGEEGYGEEVVDLQAWSLPSGLRQWQMGAKRAGVARRVSH